MLYKTGVEYGDYTANIAFGCSHGCNYPCYAFLIAKRFGKVKTIEDWKKPLLVSNALELLDKELPKLKGKISSVHLCFSTDPFMYEYVEVGELSMSVIERINKEGIPCSVLTKGILPKRLSSFSKENQYGITLISLDENVRCRVEPAAAPIEQRIGALEFLHNQGCYTWASIEPFPTPNLCEVDLLALLKRVSFVDKIVFGRLHYNRLVSQYKGYKAFYDDCARTVIDFCSKNKKYCHIKKGTISSKELLDYYEEKSFSFERL